MKIMFSMATKKNALMNLTKLISKYQADIYKNYENKIVKVWLTENQKRTVKFCRVIQKI